MTLIEKIERALALAKELGMNDYQTKELISLVIEVPFLKITTPPQTVPWTAPNTIPWMPPAQWGGQLPPNTTLINCACSPDGYNHADSCKAA
jgi:hypothetical protein